MTFYQWLALRESLPPQVQAQEMAQAKCEKCGFIYDVVPREIGNKKPVMCPKCGFISSNPDYNKWQNI